MAGFDITWKNVNQDINPALTQLKSYAPVIGDVASTLSTYADNVRAQNTQGLLQQVMDANNALEFSQAKGGVLDQMAQLGGAVDQIGLRKELALKQQNLIDQQAAQETRLGNVLASEIGISGETDPTKINELITKNGISGAGLAPINAVLASNRDAKLEQEKHLLDKVTREGALAVSVQQAKNQGVELMARVSDMLANGQGTEVKQMLANFDTGQIQMMITHTPGFADFFKSMGGFGALQSALGGGGGNSSGGSMPTNVRNQIKQAEANNDYDTLYANSHKGNGKFSNVKLTTMSVDEAIKFSQKGSPYAEWSKTQKGVEPGTYATPMGAYQIVGTTLADAAKAMGLTGKEIMTPELQDRIADWVYDNQGTAAWKAYKGPSMGGGKVGTSSGSSGSGPIAQAQSGGTSAGTKAKSKEAQTATTFNLGDGTVLLQAQQKINNLGKIREQEKNLKASTFNQEATRIDFEKFLAKNDMVPGSEMGGLRNSQNYALKTMADSNSVYRGLSAENKKKVLTGMVEWAKTNTPAFGHISSSMVKDQVNKEIQLIKANEKAALMNADMASVKSAAAEVLKAYKPTNPNMTIEDAIKMVSAKHYELLTGKGKKTTTTAVAKSKPKSKTRSSSPIARAAAAVKGERDNPFD